MKILVATDKPFAKVAVDGIRKEIEAAGYEFALLEKYTEKAQLLDAVKDANAIIIRSDIVDAEVLDAAKELKIVVRAGAGYDNVDLAAATAHNVCVMNTPGQNSNAVAELALGMMVYAVRNFYNGTSGTELMGKKLGIHAYGNVGRNVARVGRKPERFDAPKPERRAMPRRIPDRGPAAAPRIERHPRSQAGSIRPSGNAISDTGRTLNLSVSEKWDIFATGNLAKPWPRKKSPC